MTYIVHFSGFKSENNSLSHTLFGTQQKSDIHRRILFWFAEP